MRLSILTNMVPPYRVRVFQEIAASEHVSNLRVLVCTRREIDRKWAVPTSMGFTVKVIPGVTFNLKGRDGALRFLHVRYGILMELLAKRPDLLVIGDASVTAFLAAFACKVLKIKYSVWTEQIQATDGTNSFARAIKTQVYRSAETIIVPSRMSAHYAADLGADRKKITIVGNAVDNEYYLMQRERLEPLRNQIRSDLRVEKNSYCFIYAGALISRKRVVETVRLLAGVSQIKPIHLLIAGDGPLELSMREEAESLGLENISFCGFVPPDRLSELLLAADCLILLSTDEPWGMVVNEAVLFDKAFITTTTVAAGRELCNNKNRRAVSIDFLTQHYVVDFIESNLQYKVTNSMLPISPKNMAQEMVSAVRRS